MPDEHSKFSPSSASIWMTCAGSQALSEGLPEESSFYADEGTAAHSLAETAMQEGKNCVDYLGKKFGDFEVGQTMAITLRYSSTSAAKCGRSFRMLK